MGASIRGSRETRAWLNRLKTSIPEAAENAVAGGEALGAMTSRARADVLAIVYAVYSPKEYQRTFELLEAVGAVKLESERPDVTEVAIVINLTAGVQAIRDSGVSYARFFLPEEPREGFLGSPANKAAGVPAKRPFLQAWIDSFGEYLPLRLVNAIDKELGR